MFRETGLSKYFYTSVIDFSISREKVPSFRCYEFRVIFQTLPDSDAGRKMMMTYIDLFFENWPISHSYKFL
jgi:hypothetical protein